jgi:polysaccharide export outer membrane protein
MKKSVGRSGVAILNSVLSAILSFTLCAQAQEPKPPAENPPARQTDLARVGERSPSNILVEPSEDYRIGPRDVIEIRIEDAPELSGIFEVNSAGTIQMKYLNRISVLDKTPDQLSSLIVESLRGRYLKDPQVTVFIKQTNSRSFFVMGAVNRQGVYQIESRATLFTLLILAGGLAPSHGSTAYIFRRIKPGKAPAIVTEVSASPDSNSPTAAAPEYEMFPANVNGFFKGQIEGNVQLEPGDVVNVPPTDVFFVAGEVNAPGEFSLKPGTTLRQAISLARGFKFNAAKGDGIIYREDPKTGELGEIKVDIGAVMDGRKPDIKLMANDIIQVPNSKFKSFGGAVLNAFGMGAVVGRSPVRY